MGENNINERTREYYKNNPLQQTETEKEIREIHTKLNDGKITVTQATELIIDLIKNIKL